MSRKIKVILCYLYELQFVTDFLAWQASIIKEYKTSEQFVTQNFDFGWRYGSFGIQPDVNHFDAAKAFDIVGVDIYHPSQDDLTGSDISFCGDMARSMKGSNYLVLETEAQGFSSWVPYPGQLRLQAFSHLASGANMVAYWHWHSLHNAFETYWKGLLSHDFEPNPTYEEAKIIGRDFERLSHKLINLKHKNHVAVLFSNEALSALNSFKGDHDGLDYNEVLRLMYDSLYKINIGCDFVDPSSSNIEDYTMLVVPPLYAASDEILKRLNRFVENGGHIVYALRSGFSDENVKVRYSHQPGIIGDACGVYYSQFVSANKVTLKEVTNSIDEDKLSLTTWIELLIPDTAEVLARYVHPYWDKYAAITQNKYGKGTATYIGCLPSDQVMEMVIKNVVIKAGLWGRDQEIAFPLITKSGINQDGKIVHYYFNYSMNPISFQYPYNEGVELLADRAVTTLNPVDIEPWGIRIIEESSYYRF